MNSRNKPGSSVPQAFLDELLSRTSMPAVASRMVRLERAANGRVWKSACPFHEDDGTSFYVHEDGFHCFGCGAHGHAIDFVMRAASIPFDDAVRTLAEAADLDVPPSDTGQGAAERVDPSEAGAPSPGWSPQPGSGRP